jgi:SAM-dependent methyltransferase
MTGRYGGYDEEEFTAEYYDSAYDHIRTGDIVFYIDYSKNAGGRTLELGCGTGRLLIPTAAAGCEITGLDLSPYMLAKCREKLEKQPKEVQERVKLVRANMTGFDTGETYKLITVPFRAFQHLLPVEEQKACLGCVSKHLEPGGLFILDLFNPRFDRLYQTKYEDEIEDLPETQLPDGRTVHRTSRLAGFHRHEQYNDVEMIYYITHPDGREERLVQAYPFRYLFRYEVEHLLELCGFKVIDLFGNHDRSAYSDDSPEMIFIAGKK